MLDVSSGPREPVRFGVVRFEPGMTRRARDIVITFDSPSSAELFAIERGWGEDYQVVPLRFFVEELPLAPPWDSRLHLDRVLGRAPRRADRVRPGGAW